MLARNTSRSVIPATTSEFVEVGETLVPEDEAEVGIEQAEAVGHAVESRIEALMLRLEVRLAYMLLGDVLVDHHPAEVRAGEIGAFYDPVADRVVGHRATPGRDWLQGGSDDARRGPQGRGWGGCRRRRTTPPARGSVVPGERRSGEYVEAKIGLVPEQELILVAPYRDAVGHPRQRIAEHGHCVGYALQAAPALSDAAHSFRLPPLGQ